MSNIEINSTPARVQYTATASQTEFAVPFPFNTNSDLKVYQRIAGSTATDATDLLTITTEYTLTGAGAASGGTMTLVTGATVGDIVTIVGDDPIDRDTIINSPTKLTNTTLNTQFNNLTIYAKQLETTMNQLMLKYNNNEALDSGLLVDNVLPFLTPNGTWQKNAAGTAIVVNVIPPNVIGVQSDLTTDNVLVKTDTSLGTNLIQETGLTVSDADAVTGVTALTVDNILIDGNTISATSGAITITPAAGSVLNLDDSNVTVDGGVLTVTGNIAVDNLDLNGNTISSTDTNGDINLTPDGTGLNVLANAQITNVTASRAVVTDASSNLNESVTTATELSYVSGVTSAIQTQLDAKIDDLAGASTDNAIVRWDGVGGDAIQDSSVLVSDVDAITGVTALTVDNMTLDGNSLVANSGVLTLSPAAGSVLQLDDSNVTVDGGVVSVTGDVTVDNLNLNGNTLSSTSGAVTISPLAGQDINLTTSGGGEALLSADPVAALAAATKQYVDNSTSNAALPFLLGGM